MCAQHESVVSAQMVGVRARFFAASLTVATLSVSLYPTDAVADDLPRHRVSLGVSPWSFGFYDAAPSDGYYSQKGVSAIEVRGGYRFALSPTIELGGMASVTLTEASRLTVWRLQPLVRTKVDLGLLELGASLRPGLELARLGAYDITFIGLVATAGMDAGMRVAERVTIDLGLDASLGWAKPLSTNAPGGAVYFRSSTLMSLAFTPYVGATLRL